MQEIWKDIKGYEGKYQVSNTGKVISVNYNGTGKPQELKQKINTRGYKEVKLSKNGKVRSVLVGTLVGEAFLKKKNDELEIMHIGDVLDNSVNNLRYAYRSEILHKMYKKGHRKIGTPTKNKISFEGKQFENMAEMARYYNIEPRKFNKRLENGWTLEEAIKIPFERKTRKLKVNLYEYQGELLSVIDVEKRFNIHRKLIYKRLKAGWSIEDVIEIPIAKTHRGGNEK